MLFLMMLLPALNAWAQKKHPLEKSVSLTAAFGSREVSTSLAGQFLYKAGKKQRLGIGAGIKLTNYFANNQYRIQTIPVSKKLKKKHILF